jgi:hypothetical protein
VHPEPANIDKVLPREVEANNCTLGLLEVPGFIVSVKSEKNTVPNVVGVTVPIAA